MELTKGETANTTDAAAATPAPEQAPAQWVQVSVAGAKMRRIDHHGGMTLAQVLDNSQTTVEHGMLVTVNGVPAPHDSVVPANAAVVVTTPLRNG